jgi:glucose/arabinose dehydrogenase
MLPDMCSPFSRPLSALLLAALLPAGAARADLPNHFETLQHGPPFSYAVDFTFAPDGTIFLAEKTGLVRVFRGGSLQAAPLIDLSAEVNNDWDRGLLAIALRPGYTPDGGPASWIYLLYTVSPVYGQDWPFNQDQRYSFSRLARYQTLDAGGSITALPTSREVLLGNQLADGSVPDGIASVHHSHSNGSLHFGTDGSLLVATGDGAHFDFTDFGGQDDPAFDDFVHPVTGLLGPTPKIQDSGSARSQDLVSLAGKILRIDPQTGLGHANNPFYDGNLASHRSRTWALGLRNPFRTCLVPGTGSTDPLDAQPGYLISCDVGWSTWEELNLVRGGENFGWPCFEGFFPQPLYQQALPPHPFTTPCGGPIFGVLTPPLLSCHHGDPSLLQPAGIHYDENGNPLSQGFNGNSMLAGCFYSGGAYPAAFNGRMFFADYAQRWIRTLEFDSNHVPVAIHKFGKDVGNVVDMERHPLTGDVWFLSLDGETSRLLQLHYGTNLTPVVLAGASPANGPLPLQVQFQATSSFDPDADPLTITWDFGDLSAPATGPQVQHTYATAGSFLAQVTATDPLGASAGLQIPIWAGNSPPIVVLNSPLQGDLFEAPHTLQLSGSATDPEDGPLGVQWTINLIHDNHLHPGIYTSTNPNDTFELLEHSGIGELNYFEIQLSATDSQGLRTMQRAFVYPEHNVLDVSGKATPISRLQALNPPSSLGGGNPDIEVVRDGVYPPPSAPSSQQYDSFHYGEQGSDDWIGYEIVPPSGGNAVFMGLSFQEGVHLSNGGWFEHLWVEVRQAGAWILATGLRIDPSYPFASASQPGFDGQPFQVYTLRFDPLAGDAVRLRGVPGGSSGFEFMSCAELRALLAVPTPAPEPHRDITAQGTPIARVLELIPSGPTGSGSQDIETIRNDTWPAPASTSLWAQYDTQHSALPAGPDWIGYAFDGPRLFSRVVFQEGLNQVSGGSFANLELQVRDLAGTWSAIPQVLATPAYPGDPSQGAGYETFTFEFPPVLGNAVRLHGDAAGVQQFVSVAELRVDEPNPPAPCGWTSYGLTLGGSNVLVLEALTPGVLGMPVAVAIQGASGSGFGSVGVAANRAELPLFGGTLLVDPSALLTYLVSFDAQGRATLVKALPNDPSLLGGKLDVQACSIGTNFPDSVQFSQGLELTPCIW